MSDIQGSSKAKVSGQNFITAWIDLKQFPGAMMSSNGGDFGPVPAMTSCLITTSEADVRRWVESGKPVLEVQIAGASHEPPAARKPSKFDLAFEIMRQLKAEDMETMQSCQFGYVMRVTPEGAAQPPGADPNEGPIVNGLVQIADGVLPAFNNRWTCSQCGRDPQDVQFNGCGYSQSCGRTATPTKEGNTP